MEKKTYRIEFRDGVLYLLYEAKARSYKVGMYWLDSIAAKVGKVMYNRAVDGVTIFHLTEREKNKLEAVIASLNTLQ